MNRSVVEIEGERVLAASCIRKPAPGMKVKTAGARAQSARKMVFELLAADQPPKERAHDSGSRFWQWTEKLGLTRSGAHHLLNRFGIPKRSKGGPNRR